MATTEPHKVRALVPTTATRGRRGGRRHVHAWCARGCRSDEQPGPPTVGSMVDERRLRLALGIHTCMHAWIHTASTAMGSRDTRMHICMHAYSVDGDGLSRARACEALDGSICVLSWCACCGNLKGSHVHVPFGVGLRTPWSRSHRFARQRSSRRCARSLPSGECESHR